uniref:Gamma-glutamylcyclotransferase AIG2-like domain-containing protein n=1 Tax=Chenopodium quinoa TaxID=63459 RepID=A0A803LYU5_CHEQI
MAMSMTAGGTSQGYHNVFVYGSLLADEVVQVLKGITNLELDVLDIFEDIEYVRDTVEVTLVDNMEKFQTYAYVWDNKNDPDLYGDWDFEKWKSAHMKDFIEMTKEFVEELELPESKSRVETYNSFYQSGDGGKSSMP